MVLINGQNVNKITLSPKTPTIMKKSLSVMKKPADSTTGLVKKTVSTKPCVKPIVSIKSTLISEIPSEKIVKTPVTPTKTPFSKLNGLTAAKIIKKPATPLTPASPTSKTLIRDKTPKPLIKPVSKSSLSVKPIVSVKSTTKTEILKPSLTGKTLSPLKSSVRQMSSPVKSTSSPSKASPTTVLSSPLKSSPLKSTAQSSPLKSSPLKSTAQSSPLKSSPLKSTAISSPSRSTVSKLSVSAKSSPRSTLLRDIKPLPKEKTLSPSTKSIVIIPKSPLKQTSAKSAATSISKPIKLPKTGVSNRVSKIGIKLKLDISKAQEYDARNFEKPNPEPDKHDLCQCIEPYSNISVDSKTPDPNFNVVQAYKLAEQLIRIQEDENLTMNWPLEDPVLDPTSGFIDEIPTSWNPKEIFSSESCTELENSDVLQVIDVSENSTDIVRTSSNVFDNPVTGDVSELSDCKSGLIKSIADSTSDLEKEEKFGYESSPEVTPIKCESLCFSYVKISENEKQYMECQSTTEQSEEYVTSCLTDVRINEIENYVECKSTIQELDKENKSPLQITPSPSVCPTYADILKKVPTVLTNATNITPKQPAPLVNLQKDYQMLKKVENLYATNIFFPKIDSDVDSTIYDGEYDEIEYSFPRKKNCKKVKHFSKRYLKNIRRDFQNVEDAHDYTNVFITPVWKNIY